MCKASVKHFELERVTELKKKRSLRKEAGDRQLTALLASRVAASLLLGLVSTYTAHLILIRDQRSVVSTAQSIILLVLGGRGTSR